MSHEFMLYTLTTSLIAQNSLHPQFQMFFCTCSVPLIRLCLPLLTSYFCSHYLSILSVFLSSSSSSISLISTVLFTHSPHFIALVTCFQLSRAPAAQFTSIFLILFLLLSLNIFPSLSDLLGLRL